MSRGLEGSDGIDCRGNDLPSFMSPDNLKKAAVSATESECDYLNKVV